MLNLNKQRLLAIAPHPDDEVLGCGGLIKRVKDGGGSVFVLFMTVGDTKDYSAKGLSTKTERIREIESVAKSLGFEYAIALAGNGYHLQLDHVPQLKLIGLVEKYIHEFKPTILATTMAEDYNQDHRACAEAVFAATRPTPLTDKYNPSVVLGYRSVFTAAWAEPQLSNLSFHLELNTADLAAKSRALGLYTSQVRGKGHQRTPKAVEKISNVLGLAAGVEFAESYMVYRFLVGVKE